MIGRILGWGLLLAFAAVVAWPYGESAWRGHVLHECRAAYKEHVESTMGNLGARVENCYRDGETHADLCIVRMVDERGREFRSRLTSNCQQPLP